MNNVITPRGIDAATIVVGQNSNWDAVTPPIINTGLEVRCNDYTNNDFAISVFNGNMRKIQGVAGGQTNQLAGNQFHSTMVNGMEFNVNVESELGSINDYSEFSIGEDYKYYQHDDNNDVLIFHRELELDRINGVHGYTVQGRDFVLSTSCPSNFGLHPYDHITAVRDISDRKSTLLGLQDQYNQTVDRGDTEYMLSLAENLSPHNFRQAIPILSNNGYLSDTVFDALLNNTSAQKPVIASILIANSPLPDQILDAVNNSAYLSNGHKNQINNYQTGENARVLLEYQISDIEQNIIDIEGEIVNNAVNNDSIPESLYLAIDYFGSKPDAEISDIITVYNLTMFSEDFQATENILESLRNMTTNLSLEEREELTKFCDVNEIYLSCIGDTIMSDVLLANKDFLFTAAQSQSPLYSALAEVLYSYTTDSVFYEYTPMPFEIVTPRSINIIDDTEEETYSIFELYPNPTSDIIYVEYDFSQIYDEAMEFYNKALNIEQIEDCKFGRIKIYSNDAKLIEEIPLENDHGIQKISLKNYVPGQYLVELIDCYGNSQVKKLSKK